MTKFYNGMPRWAIILITIIGLLLIAYCTLRGKKTEQYAFGEKEVINEKNQVIGNNLYVDAWEQNGKTVISNDEADIDYSHGFRPINNLDKANALYSSNKDIVASLISQDNSNYTVSQQDLSVLSNNITNRNLQGLFNRSKAGANSTGIDLESAVKCNKKAWDIQAPEDVRLEGVPAGPLKSVDVIVKTNGYHYDKTQLQNAFYKGADKTKFTPVKHEYKF